MNKRLILFILLVGLFTLVTVVLLGNLAFRHITGDHPNYEAYTAVADLLLVIVIAIEGLLALWEFSHSQQSTKAAANSAVFDLYKMYLSIDYHKQVRRPAWFSLSKARKDSQYCRKILAGLAGDLVGDEIQAWAENQRACKEITEDDTKSLLIHDDYHRVQDILGFFTTLSLLASDADTVQMCNFFYDRWRVPLHRIVFDLEAYCKSTANLLESEEELRRRRYGCYLKALTKLDKIFEMERFDWKADPLSKIFPDSE